MYSHAQPKTFSATALLYLAAALRTAAYRVRAVAGRLNADTKAASACESCGDEPNDGHQVDELAHLDKHVLKDIGAPHWLVAHAAERHANERQRWIGLEYR